MPVTFNANRFSDHTESGGLVDLGLGRHSSIVILDYLSAESLRVLRECISESC